MNEYILEPPSYSAAVEKMGMKEAIYSLAKRLNFILMFFVFSITLGAALAFSGKRWNTMIWIQLFIYSRN